MPTPAARILRSFGCHDSQAIKKVIHAKENMIKKESNGLLAA
ncbi:hypothetical protein [Lactobacillus sp. ESL0259]|nr:hypothetical protein [Lactobacillus sp. ESL0259]